MKISNTLVGLFISLVAHSQNDFVTISGQMVDVETKKPLSFATINIQNTAKGGVANEDGAFDFTFPSTYLSDTIVFSMTGYQTEKVLAQSLSDQTSNTIQLVSKEVMLAEVVVTNKELTAWGILELAKDNIKNNYPTNPFEFEAFYRDYKIENQKCVSIFEAACSVYDKGYSKASNKDLLKEKVVLEQVRKSLKVDFQTHSFKRLNILKELLTLNDVRYQSRALNKKGPRNYTHEMDGYDLINNRLMYRIKAVANWTFYIYVDVVTYAIPRIEMDYTWVDDVTENEWILGDTIKYRQTTAQEILEFQMIDGLYYPKYTSFRFTSEALEPETDSLLFTSALLQEFLVTSIDFTPEEKPEKRDRMDPYLMIEMQDFPYSPEFWKNYNVIKLNPRDKKLIKDLEDQMKLEEQFSANDQ